VRRKWLARDEPPLALLFISHRWETLEHPDPSGRQLAALQEFLRLVCRCIEAMFLTRYDRLRLVPTLLREGLLQAEEIARRLLGFGPFSEDLSRYVPKAPALIRDAFDSLSGDPTVFRRVDREANRRVAGLQLHASEAIVVGTGNERL
jgi:hypothetical protein